jgi:hypothetical protein
MILEIVDTGYEEAGDMGPLGACCYMFWLSSHP